MKAESEKPHRIQQKGFFGNVAEGEVKREAIFSHDRKHRYVLSRLWDEKKPRLMFVCLNPSVADENEDDNTVRRMIRFAVDWQFGGLRVLNVFAAVATKPFDMLRIPDPVGPKNDIFLIREAQEAGMIVAAWGGFHEQVRKWRPDDMRYEVAYENIFVKRVRIVEQMLSAYPLYCLGHTKEGSPRHPLYMPKAVRPQFFMRYAKVTP